MIKVFFILSIALNIYFFSKVNEPQVIQETKIVEVEKTREEKIQLPLKKSKPQKQVAKKEELNQEKAIIQSNEEESTELTSSEPEELSEFSQDFDEQFRRNEENIKDYLELDLRIPREKVDKYLTIKEKFNLEQSKMIDEQKKSEELSLIDDQTQMALLKHKKEYLDLIKKEFGDTDFQKYRDRINLINQQAFKSAQSGEPIFLIDL